jgi:very-short-patch-repair endonuclease
MEAQLARILNTVDGCKLRDDGGYHNNAKQRCVDTFKARACEEAGVTLIRITNDEVFGDREILLKKVRQGLLRALLRGKS